MGPWEPVGQGLQQSVMVDWAPFWRNLTDEQKEDYLNRWNASPEWRDAIDARYNVTDEELAEEAREFRESYVEEAKGRGGFLVRIKGIFRIR
ncbi:hypothetical protein AA23498_3265 [Acetobacter nitrogenifigens DSM 23921 = NBRC 105050]|uniref:Uncharacterized protein n=1 Tax=Acetobacter nitrogenifigens DSM 23921 = NBRC 105050 TaxID=1120919 RepID=A0A511X5T7_9PROT|nr:hypothetical protein [Acetobacter nitrogenifigens]GBQ98558.1 hypothetical protein AA23498_3265 [Acetobacter nitrogenifigens DSM 23921 = NBRC 105050]GEN58318.1 hypothetical protein ANI02nite_02020 [Acetobacter nitrogenifigens DSM 23921 = NBRC 105050]